MGRFKRERWKANITVAGMLLLLVLWTWLMVLIVWAPMSAVGAYERASGLAMPVAGTVQATPTEDATRTALEKEKLEQEVQQLKYQNEQLKNQNALDFFVWFPGWFRTNATILLSTLVVVIGGLIGLFRWFGDRRSEREKRAEERFQKAVEGLGSEREEAKIGAAITLGTFLRRGYEQFYIQTFHLAVAHLRLPPKLQHTLSQSFMKGEQDTHLDIGSLNQVLIYIFKKSFPLARKEMEKQSPPFDSQMLDASDIQAFHPKLRGADLAQCRLARASLRHAILIEAHLKGAKLGGADLFDAKLYGAHLEKADLGGAHLEMADLSGANLKGADLKDADLRGADLSGANLDNTTLDRARYNTEIILVEDKPGHVFAIIQPTKWPQGFTAVARSIEPYTCTPSVLYPRSRWLNLFGHRGKLKAAMGDKRVVDNNVPDTYLSRCPKLTYELDDSSEKGSTSGSSPQIHKSLPDHMLIERVKAEAPFSDE